MSKKKTEAQVSGENEMAHFGIVLPRKDLRLLDLCSAITKKTKKDIISDLIREYSGKVLTADNLNRLLENLA
jgi:hypothetical protein